MSNIESLDTFAESKLERKGKKEERKNTAKCKKARGLAPQLARGDRITSNRQPLEMPIRENENNEGR